METEGALGPQRGKGSDLGESAETSKRTRDVQGANSDTCCHTGTHK